MPLKSQLIKRWQPTLIWAAIILALAILLRTYNPFSVPVFADEAIYIRWAQVMRAVPSLRFVPLSDGKQPFFMWLEIPFLKVFADPILAGRAVSMVAGIGTLAGIFFLTYQLFKDKKTALLGSLLYAVSPFSVFFDRMALADSLLTMFGVWSLYFGVLTAQTLRLDFAMLTGFGLGLAWLTKSPAMFFFLLLPSTILLAQWKNDRAAQLRTGLKLLSLWMVSWGIGLALYNILRLGPEFHMIGIRNKDYLFPLSEVLKHPSDPLRPHLGDVYSWFINLLPGTTFALSIAGAVVGLKRNWKATLILLAWCLGPLIAEAAVAKVFTARYILFTLPPLFVLSGVALAGLNKHKKLFLGVLGISLLVPLWINSLLLTNPAKAPLPHNERSGYLEEWSAGQGIREIAQLVKEEKQKNPTQNITIGTEGFFGTLPDGLQIYLADIPGVVVKGVGITLTEVDSSLIQAKASGDTVFLVVNSTRFKIENFEEKGLKQKASYPKAKRANGTQESLLFFSLEK